MVKRVVDSYKSFYYGALLAIESLIEKTYIFEKPHKKSMIKPS